MKPCMVADRGDRLCDRGRPRWHEAPGRRGRSGVERAPPCDAAGARAPTTTRCSTRSSRRSREVRDAIEGASGSVDAVGIGIPALIDTARGIAVMSTHLPLAGVPFRDLVAERIGLPVFVDNDANAAMLAEWRFGAARGARDAALLTIGTGHRRRARRRRRAAARQPGRGRRARPHGRPGRRAALQRQLPQPRLPGVGLLGHGAGARGAAPRRGAPALGARPRRSPRAARSPVRS